MNASRQDFPLLVKQPDLVYLDNAATTQKPQSVIDAITSFYTNHNANAHRGVHALGDAATNDYEQSRQTVAQFINAPAVQNVIFTSGTTHGLNALALGIERWMRKELSTGEQREAVIVTSWAEHNTNLLPWMRVAKELGCHLELLPLTVTGELDLDAWHQVVIKYGKRIKVVSLSTVSNVLGLRNSVESIISEAHQLGAWTFLDAAQSVAHERTDVQTLGADALVFSGHKVYGPQGIGVVAGSTAWLNEWEPSWVGGGGVERVAEGEYVLGEVPARFEAGTPHVAGAVGLAAALRYLSRDSWEQIQQHEQSVLQTLVQGLATIPEVTIIGTSNSENRRGVISFTVKNIHPHDIGGYLDQQHIAVRAGHHCTHVLHQKLQVTGTCRISVGLYTTSAEMEKAVQAVKQLVADFK